MAVHRFDGIQIRSAGNQYAVIDSDGHLTDNRQTGVLQ